MTQANEGSNNDVTPEIQGQFSAFIEPFFSTYHRVRCYPGLIFQQGKRTMLQINVPAGHFSDILRADPADDNDPNSGKNRPEVKGHVEEIKEYVLERVRKGKPWILGTITANVAAEKIKILEFTRGICLVVIRRGVKLDITDGQHRKRAIHELIESDEGELISDADFPITLVLEGDFRQCQIDFKDMAQTRPLDNSLLKSFGEYEGQIGIMWQLIEKVPMFHNRTEKIKATPPSKKGLIYTTNYIARFISCVFANNPNDELLDLDVDKCSEALVNCLNQFFYECNQTRNTFEKTDKKLKSEEVIVFKEKGLLGMSAGLETLGRLLYLTYTPDTYSFNQDKVSQLAQINWTRSDPIWENNLIRIDPNPKNPDKRYKLSTGANAVTDAVKTLKSKLGWIENPSY
ncbi:DNA sulfur modification protein DndB [Nostoc sp. DedQUE07]|uniref:DNA sulfur modification protein DndB n=1 Tax=Nostoc sp. DedQUE07 TaxID=3075392 RepID=UPI002AD50B0A|nr:DNA sulfur modification protein DndB [Nostoc sp. DedQUE07]MDZ8131280.1 DNA sulfur modification protein DndB [Nostoc sp. DedQUE07]